MTTKLKHTRWPWAVAIGVNRFILGPEPRDRSEREQGDNMRLVGLSATAPHHCVDPECPGDVNRRKLEAFEPMLAFIKKMTASDQQIPPRIREEAGYVLNLLHGVAGTGHDRPSHDQGVAG